MEYKPFTLDGLKTLNDSLKRARELLKKKPEDVFEKLAPAQNEIHRNCASDEKFRMGTTTAIR